MKKIFSILLLLGLLVAANPCLAQSSNVGGIIPQSVEVNYSDINKKLSKIETSLKKENASSAGLSDDIAYINTTRSQLIEAKKNIDRNLKFVEKRIEALGEEPKDGSKEVELIAQKRKEFNSELANAKGKIAEADILLTKLDELDISVLNLRNRELLGNLLVRGTPLIYPAEVYYSTKLFVEFFFDIIKSPIEWYGELNENEHAQVKSKLIPVALIVFFATWLGIYLRLFIMRKFGYRKDVEHPRYGKKVMAALSVAIAYGVIPALIIGSFFVWLLSTKILNSSMLGLVLNSFLYYSLYVIMGRAVSRVIFAPYNERWRLVNVSNQKAKRMISALYFSVTMIGVMACLVNIATVSNYSIELLSYLTAMSSAVKAICIILIVKRLMWEGIDSNEHDEELEIDIEEEDSDGQVNTAFRVTFFISLFAVIVFGLSLFGYPYLSAFILNRFIISFLLIGLVMVLRKSFYEVIHRLLLLRFWVQTFRLRRKIISKIDFWSSLVIDPMFALITIFMVLALWGVPIDVLSSMVYKLFMGFTVGGVQISLISIAFGIFVFFVAITIIKGIKKRLQDNVLAKMDIDDGIRHSLAAGFGSLGYVASALLAIAIMGGNLTNFALIAGALSFGIGLGLQNVVNNFISGIILLFERPIKVGDWIIVNGQEGVVKQINIRSTELETWKRANIIIPNSDLLSSIVTNLTHDDKWGRVDIQIGVAYGSDVEKVRDILVEIATENKRVLKKPAPYAVFINFGDSSLDFELRCFTADVMNSLGISSELRFEINRRFNEEKISIPFPQRVLHLDENSMKEIINSTLMAKKV